MLPFMRFGMRAAALMTGAACGIVLAAATRVSAQDAPPPIPRFVVDLHGVVFPFPDAPEVAASRGLVQAELPGTGFGGDLAVHLYPFKWRAVTFGIGGRIVRARARSSPTPLEGQPPLHAVTEEFSYAAPQLSFNFGTGAGWSYLSAGIGRARWTLTPPDDPVGPPNPSANDQRLKTIDYGGGARWFAKPHVAFSFDVRFYAVNPSTPGGAQPPSPRTTLLVVGAGVSIK
jgi:hypothetical protein